jgi:molybdenum cofactor synthesis domain-containing protein
MAANVTGSGRRAFVLTVSDGVAAGVREDSGGDGVARRLGELGFVLARGVVADDPADIAAALVSAAAGHELVLTTGGTGLTPRDVTPQATKSVLEYEVPGLSELMRAEGGRTKPQAFLSRSVAGVRTRCLIVNLPGSPRGALESLAAIEPILEHALATLAGPFDHDPGPTTDAEPRG